MRLDVTPDVIASSLDAALDCGHLGSDEGLRTPGRGRAVRTTLILSQILGPVLLLRGVSILLDRRHFIAMLDGLEKEASTVAFSLFPIALLMASIAVVLTHSDTSTPAAIIIHVIAWGGILKGSALILVPKLVLAKARLLGRAGFLEVVWLVCFGVGAYFTWFGYCRQ
ncbi:MAG: hypothetical protein ACT4QD_10230 [Acidobacteriota bacterium]